MAKDYDQLNIGGLPGRTVPLGTIKSAGKRTKDIAEQGDAFRPDKIAPGNLPQDQLTIGIESGGPKSPVLPGQSTARTVCEICGEEMIYLIWQDAAQTKRTKQPKAHNGMCLAALKERQAQAKIDKEARKRAGQ